VRSVAPPTEEQINNAQRVVGEMLTPTPLVRGLKLETLQPTGSFKVRGGLAAVAAAPPGARIVTVSAGNHGLGVAWAAARLGREATVVVPATASPAKIARLREFDCELVLHGEDYDAAEAYALALGGHFVSPYNDPDVIAGARTLAVELGEQVGGPYTVAVPVGGGGLLSGIALYDQAHPIGVEVVASRGLSAARAGRPLHMDPTLADGMAGSVEPGSVTVELTRHVELVAVTEDGLRRAMRELLLDHGILAEGSGAAAYAAGIPGAIAIVSGRNVVPKDFAQGQTP
jgi:threonine dehydratase